MITVVIVLMMFICFYVDVLSMMYMPMFFIVIASIATLIKNQNNIDVDVKIFLVIWFIMFGGLPFVFMTLPALLYDVESLKAFTITIVTIGILIVFLNIMPKRTKYGNEILGRIRGFKRFLKTAEKEKLESLVHENPEYFYDILPYTYALGVSKKWMNQFETIAMQAPDWYDYNGAFMLQDFNHFMTDTMRTAHSSMISTPSSGFGGGGDGFSGGGFSGGGSGGGRRRFVVSCEEKFG